MGAEFKCSKDRGLTDGTRLEHLVAGCVEISLACVIFALLHVRLSACIGSTAGWCTAAAER
jgi:hypothetical protein